MMSLILVQMGFTSLFLSGAPNSEDDEEDDYLELEMNCNYLDTLNQRLDVTKWIKIRSVNEDSNGTKYYIVSINKNFLHKVINPNVWENVETELKQEYSEIFGSQNSTLNVRTGGFKTIKYGDS